MQVAGVSPQSHSPLPQGFFPHSEQVGWPQSSGQMHLSSPQVASHFPLPHFCPHSPQAGGPQSSGQAHLSSPQVASQTPLPQVGPH
jgi:hypothetical protein